MPNPQPPTQNVLLSCAVIVLTTCLFLSLLAVAALVVMLRSQVGL